MIGKPYQRITRLPKRSFFLFGPRGIGKSTWARENLRQARRFDLLDEALYQDLLADPSLLSGQLATLPPQSWVVLDEIQRIPALLNEVHRFIEQRRDLGERMAHVQQPVLFSRFGAPRAAS